MLCPCCNQELTSIIAEHEYAIDLIDLNTRQWVKSVGEVTYRHYASGCMEALDPDEIADILKQVDKL
jgi:hypothetical protein